jgi:hypothetical protein
MFGLEAADCLLVVAPFVSMAGAECILHPFQHGIVEVEAAEQFGELMLQDLFAHVLAPAGSRVAQAFIGIASAVVVDVALLFNLADHGTPTFAAGYQAGEGEVMCHAPVLLGESTVEDALHPLP